jgi:hypothetical protein
MKRHVLVTGLRPFAGAVLILLTASGGVYAGGSKAGRGVVTTNTGSKTGPVVRDHRGGYGYRGPGDPSPPGGISVKSGHGRRPGSLGQNGGTAGGFGATVHDHRN